MESSPFESIDGMSWQLRLKPGNWPNRNTFGLENNRPSPSQICLVAIPTPKEKEAGEINRNVTVEFYTYQASTNKKNSVKDW